MTHTFERFLRGFDDEDLVAFARDRGAIRPPYWKVMALALRIEADRRGLRLDDELLDQPANSIADGRPARIGTA